MPKNVILKISQKGARKTVKALKSVAGGLTSIGKKAALVSGGLGILSVKLAGDFQKSLLEVTTLMTKVNDRTLPNMSYELRNVAASSGLALKSISKAKYDIVSAGFSSAADSAKVLAASAKLAVGGVTTAASAADLLTTALNAYGKTSEEVTNVSDTLFTTVRLGKTTMNELAASLGQVLPFSKAMNLSLKDVGASMAVLTASGINTAEATTALRSAIIQLNAPSKGAKDAMNEAGISVKRFEDGTVDLVETIRQFQGLDPETIKKYIPNVRAIAAVQTMANNFEKLEDNVRQFSTETANASQTAFEKMTTAFNTQFAMLRNNSQNIMITIGDAIIKVIQPKIEAANKEFEKIGKIGWENVSQTISDNIEPILDTLGKAFNIFFNMIDNRLGLLKIKFLDAINPFVDMSEKIGVMQAKLKIEMSASTGLISQLFTNMYNDIVDKAWVASKKQELAAKKPATEVKENLTPALKDIETFGERFEAGMLKAEGGIIRAKKATKDWEEDLGNLIKMLGPVFEKVKVPGMERGTNETYIDFFTGLNVAFANTGETSQVFWDNLTGGMQNGMEMFDGYVSGVSSLFENMYAHKKQLLDNDMNAEIKSSQASFERRKKEIINSNTVGGKLTEDGQKKLQELETGHNSAINNIKEEFRQKEIEAQKKLKPIKYAQAVSDTASAVIGALGNKPWTPLNFALAGVVAAAGAAEIATIAAQPFAQGGLVGGVGNIDSVPAILTPGEFVMSKQAVQNIGAQNLADMNQGGGGITLNITAPLVDESVVDHIIPAIEKAQRMNLA
jgi:TP901 family phage tail tape measure protein